MINILSDNKLDEGSIIISSDLAYKIGIQENKRVNICVGQTQKCFTVRVKKAAKNLDSISLSPANLKSLYLKSGRKYGIRPNEDEIHIGPVVGIMVDVFNESQKPFGGQTHFVKQLLTSGNSLGQICFAFSPYGVDLNRGIIKGYTFGGKNWIKGVFPLPDVIYPRERAYTRSKLEIRKKIESNGIALLNPTLVGKWETHKILMKNSNLHQYLPETRLVKSFNDIEQMLKTYNAVYLKPVAGSQGRNIIRVIRRKQYNLYEYRYIFEGRIIKGSASNMVNLQKSLRGIMKNRSYIVQKQINLLKCQGNILDVRVLVQKDHTGEWDVTGMACRIGSEGSITSNISSGGSGRKIEEVLKQNFSSSHVRMQIMDDIHFVSIASTKTLENAIGQCGEMGIDIGIDTCGKVWFIEANIRPARHVFNLIGETETRLRSVERPMLYARYLSGF